MPNFWAALAIVILLRKTYISNCLRSCFKGRIPPGGAGGRDGGCNRRLKASNSCCFRSYLPKIIILNYTNLELISYRFRLRSRIKLEEMVKRMKRRE